MIEHTPVPLSDLDAVRAAITAKTRLIWVETPTNPLLSIADIAGDRRNSPRRTNAKVLVDNTFASPALQQPLTLGADIVLHSTTKYIGGHSDVVGGALLTNDEELDSAFAFPAERCRGGAGPVRRLPDHARPQDAGAAHAAAQRQRRAGRRIPRRPSGDRDGAVPGPAEPPRPRRRRPADERLRRHGLGAAAWRAARLRSDLCSRTEVFILAESLGGVESLIEHPGAMTHASTAGSQLEVPDDLVRLSVGIEDAADLLADLEQALRLGAEPHSADAVTARFISGSAVGGFVNPTATGDFAGAGVHPAPAAVVEAQQRAEAVDGVQQRDDRRRRRGRRAAVEQRRQQRGAGVANPVAIGQRPGVAAG